MSDYYDLTKPYKIEDWNLLVTDVNEILQNPPAGTDCEPVAPLDEVTDPHRWAVEDIEDMRNALIETCPDISFETELVLWKAEIIDEIEFQMEYAWCACLGESNCTSFSDSVEGAWIYAAFSATNSGGAMYEDYFGTLCPGLPSSQTIWTSTWYPPVDNVPLKNAARAISSIASAATGEFKQAWNDMMSAAQDIITYQWRLDRDTSEMDGYIEAYEDCIAEQAALPGGGDSSACDFYKPWICGLGESAAFWQEKVNEYVSDFQTAMSGTASDALADSAASDYMSIVLSMAGRFPRERNFWETVYSSASGGLDWKRLIYPIPGGRIRGVPMGSTTTLEEIMAHGSPALGTSPGGVIFSTMANPHLMVTETTNWFSQKEVRHRCEQWGGKTCPDDCGDDVPACEWKCWETDWECGVGTGNPLTIVGCARESGAYPFDKDAMVGPSRSISGYICRNPSTADYTEEQEDFKDTYLDWFEDHPQYDDRHEDYC